jgi:hypothetical protein
LADASVSGRLERSLLIADAGFRQLGLGPVRPNARIDMRRAPCPIRVQGQIQ